MKIRRGGWALCQGYRPLFPFSLYLVYRSIIIIFEIVSYFSLRFCHFLGLIFMILWSFIEEFY